MNYFIRYYAEIVSPVGIVQFEIGLVVSIVLSTSLVFIFCHSSNLEFSISMKQSNTPFGWNLIVFHVSFQQLLNSLLKSFPSFSANPPPIHQTQANTKTYSTPLTSYLSIIDSSNLQILIAIEISIVGTKYLKLFLIKLKVGGRYLSTNC